MKVMKDAGLELRKWMNNDKDFQNFFDRGEVCESTIGDDTTFSKDQINGTSNNGRHKVLV